jgi:hypothetical protein
MGSEGRPHFMIVISAWELANLCPGIHECVLEREKILEIDEAITIRILNRKKDLENCYVNPRHQFRFGGDHLGVVYLH